MKNKLLYIVSILSILSGVIIIGITTFWLVYPYKPMTVNKEPIEVMTGEVGRGKPLIYRIDYCKNVDVPATIQKSYENDIIFPASTTHPVNNVGCRVVNISQVIPYELPSGRYKLKIVFTYRVNPIREVSITAYTEYFNVIERD